MSYMICNKCGGANGMIGMTSYRCACPSVTAFPQLPTFTPNISSAPVDLKSLIDRLCECDDYRTRQVARQLRNDQVMMAYEVKMLMQAMLDIQKT